MCSRVAWMTGRGCRFVGLSICPVPSRYQILGGVPTIISVMTNPVEVAPGLGVSWNIPAVLSKIRGPTAAVAVCASGIHTRSSV